MDGNALGIGLHCRNACAAGIEWITLVCGLRIVGHLICWFLFIFFFFFGLQIIFAYFRICHTIDGIKRETKRREREERKRRSHIQL